MKKNKVTLIMGPDFKYYCLAKNEDHPELEYKAANADAAASGLRRLIKKKLKGVKVTPAGSTVAKKKKVYVGFVLDISGSMAGLLNDAKNALISNLRTLLESSVATGVETHVSIFTFNNFFREVVSHDLRSNQDITTINTALMSVYADGGTALYDAVIKATDKMKTLSKFDGDVSDSYLIMAVTDGYENSSKANGMSMKSAMREVVMTDKWTYSILVPPGASRIAASLGFDQGNIREWEASSAGVSAYAAANNKAVSSYYTIVSSSSTPFRSTNFYQTDLSKITTTDLKTKLNDISRDVRVYTVDKEEDIRTFVEKHLGSYKPGSAFYQLTKNEKKIQDYKQLLVMEKNKSNVWGGDDARHVLGIPQGDLNVTPGNHSNFDLFVQSTSVNRKLVRGTKVIVKI